MLWSELKALVEEEMIRNDIDDATIEQLSTPVCPDNSHPSTEIFVSIDKIQGTVWLSIYP